MPCTGTPRRASGSAIRPVPMPSSRAGPSPASPASTSTAGSDHVRPEHLRLMVVARRDRLAEVAVLIVHRRTVPHDTPETLTSFPALTVRLLAPRLAEWENCLSARDLSSARPYQLSGRPTPTASAWRPRCGGVRGGPADDAGAGGAAGRGLCRPDRRRARDDHARPEAPPQAGAAPTSTRDAGIIAGFRAQGPVDGGAHLPGAGGDRQRRDRPPPGPVHRRRDDDPRHRDHRHHHRRGARRRRGPDRRIGVLGGFDHRDEGPGMPGAPRITITGFAFCGSVDVERRAAGAETPSPRLKRAQRRLERKQRSG